MGLLAALVVCYVLGSIPTAYLLVNWTTHVDIRTVGSGNVGATNTARAAGLWAGLIVFAVDLLKGVVAAGVIPAWFGQTQPESWLVCGLASVIGHDFPCWLGFRGGKGVATTMGVLLGCFPLLAGLVGGVWAVTFVFSRYVSLSSLAAAIAIPLSLVALRHSLREIVLGAILGGLIVVRHRTNIQRLLAGAEHRAWSRKG